VKMRGDSASLNFPDTNYMEDSFMKVRQFSFGIDLGSSDSLSLPARVRQITVQKHRF
jgi:hypothetical protein